jgi:hypothetical protein
MHLGGWTRLWILAAVLWAVPVIIIFAREGYWERNLTLDGVQDRYVRDMVNDLALAIQDAEGGRLESDVVDKAADMLLGSGGRTIAGFEELAGRLPTLVQRMKRVPFAAPENGMDVRYYVFPVDATTEEVAGALATESSRRQITEWARNEPVQLDLLQPDAASVPSGVQSIELETKRLLTDYHREVEQLPKERLLFLFGTSAWWAVPALVLYAIGWAVAWVRRGFSD